MDDAQVEIGDWILSFDREDISNHVWGRIVGMSLNTVYIATANKTIDADTWGEYPVYSYARYTPTKREVVEWMIAQMKF